MILLDNQTALVFNTNDLRDAVSTDNGIDYVFFGADITLAYGITIYPNKPSLVIDGQYEGVIHTFTDMNSTGSGNTIGIRSASNIEITFKNMIMYGRNFYGIPYVTSNSSITGVSCIYQNVTYRGSQITHNPYGLARYIDCDISIETLVPAAASSLQEVGEVCRLEIGGKTIMRKVDSNAVFWFRGTANTNEPYMRILQGADVTISTENYFMYADSRPVTYTIESGASLTLNTQYSISFASGHRVASFFVGSNASFRNIRKNNGVSATTLYINDALTVSEGAEFYMQSAFASTDALIHFTSSSARLIIDNPKSFVLYNGGTATNAAVFSFSYSTPFTLKGGQVNYWRNSRPFPTAGTFQDAPLHKWNRPSWAAFTLSGTAATSGTNTNYNDFTPEELASQPSLTLLQLQQARVLSIGNLPLTVSTVIAYDTFVRGTTEPAANVLAEFTSGGTLYSSTDIADENGFYSINMYVPLPLEAYVAVSSNTPFLIVKTTVETKEAGELKLVSAPELIEFVLPPISLNPILLSRTQSSIAVNVEDTRATPSTWRLLAAIDGDFKTAGGYILPEAVVFVDEDGSVITLSETPVTVYTSGPDGGSEVLTWPEDRGVLARITAPVRNRETYSNRLIWSVEPVTTEPDQGTRSGTGGGSDGSS